MSEKKLYSVKEFAEIIGISHQAVYKKLRNELKTYVEIIDGKRYIRDDYFIQKKQEIQGKTSQPETTQPQLNEVAQLVAQQLRNQLNTANPSESDATLLREQLAAKDRQIEALENALAESQKQNAKKDEYIQEQGKKMAALIEQANQIASQAQVLHLAEKATPEAIQEPGQEPEAEQVEDSKKKDSFWRHLFKKK